MNYEKKHKHTCDLRVPNYVIRGGTTYRDLAKENCTYLLEFLLSYIVRGKNKNSEVDLYEEYYKKGYLATCWAQSKLADIMGVSRSAIANKIKRLEDLGCLNIHKKVIHGKVQNVYVLGTVTEKIEGNKKVFYEDIYAWKAILKHDLSNPELEVMMSLPVTS